MTLRQTIQAAPAKSNELLTKLADTSNQAVKTREKLLADLGDELRLYVDLEDKHLFPVLRKHDATKGLVSEAGKANRVLLKVLGELEQTPKDSDAFLEKLGDLRQAFRQNLRDERQELLPAVLKALDAEEANELAATLEAGAVDAENAKREEAREARDAAKRTREAEQARAEAEQAAVRAQRTVAATARRATDQAADIVRLEAAAVEQTGRQAVQAAVDAAGTATAAVSGAISVYRESTQARVEDLRAVTAASSTSARGLAEVGSALTDWLGKTVRTNTEATQRLLQCRNLQQLAEVQLQFGATMMRNWMEANARVLEVAQQSSKQALKPLSARLQPEA